MNWSVRQLVCGLIGPSHQQEICTEIRSERICGKSLGNLMGLRVSTRPLQVTQPLT